MPGDRLLVGVDHEQNFRQSGHFLDTTEGAVQLVALPFEPEKLLLGEKAVFLGELLLQLAQPLDGMRDGLPVGQHAAEPAVIDIVLAATRRRIGNELRSEEHTSELQSLMRISYAVFCLKKKKKRRQHNN